MKPKNKRFTQNVIGEFDSLIDSLLSHTEEDHCSHSVMYLIEQFVDKNKNFNKSTKVETALPNIGNRNSLNQVDKCRKRRKKGEEALDE